MSSAGDRIIRGEHNLRAKLQRAWAAAGSQDARSAELSDRANALRYRIRRKLGR